MDGGFTDNLPTIDENTILISPFAGECDICPYDEIPHYGIGVRKIANTSVNLSINNFIRLVNGFFAPPAEMLMDYCWRGYDDALRYLTENSEWTANFVVFAEHIIIIIIIYPLTMRAVGVPQMVLQPVSSNFPCSPLPSGTWQTPGLSIP